MLSLVNNEPKILNLKQIIENYILHRKNVITRRTKFDLNKAEEKEHILEGLKIALQNIDNVISLIKQAEKDNYVLHTKEKVRSLHFLQEERC